ncbi:leucine rich adaptor protein 1-like [Sphaeramia orbicularis]|uniref:Leucine rich adaptor protein 1-like n=1 Tax=Sphaeramia orbicularis TaxID=375764 RepID=A0A672YQ62_9TELE|nr:leucine rich adaptor protein 1-like [Sphaeramia orbicularis]
MAEEIPNDSFPDLKELENKVGRKTPESLLIWMKDAAESEDGWRCEGGEREGENWDFSDSFSEKITNLKQEMRWLRSADVRILRQLVALHEGIEALRWLIEERGTLASRGSSLTGSLSSLITMDECGPFMSPCRETQSPICPQEFVETTEDSEHQPLHNDESNHKSSFDTRSDSAEARPPSLSSLKFDVRRSIQGRQGSLKSQPQDSGGVSSHDNKDAADPVRSALLRSNRSTRREVKVNTGSLTFEKRSGETRELFKPQESFRESLSKKMDEDKSVNDKEGVLLGYDAQWCWVESQDDVTFL